MVFWAIVKEEKEEKEEIDRFWGPTSAFAMLGSIDKSLNLDRS